MPFVDVKKNEEFIFSGSVVDSANRPDLKSNPTIAAGDFQVSTDFGSLGNLATIPAVTPASSIMIKFTLSTDEMNGGVVVVTGIDAAGAEWDDNTWVIITKARDNDDLCFPTVAGNSTDVTSGGNVGIDLDNTSGDLADSQFNADVDTYQAKVWIIDDDSNSTDRYMVAYYMNAEPITSGITVPKIQVIKTTDGADLIAETALTEVGSEGVYYHSETTNRIVAGATYYAKITATIASATRTWWQPLGRDS